MVEHPVYTTVNGQWAGWSFDLWPPFASVDGGVEGEEPAASGSGEKDIRDD